jgi:hypothetical protein
VVERVDAAVHAATGYPRLPLQGRDGQGDRLLDPSISSEDGPEGAEVRAWEREGGGEGGREGGREGGMEGKEETVRVEGERSSPQSIG